MKIAYTGWTWLVNHKDNYQWEFEQFLKEVADIGYDSVENFAFITDYFDNDAAKVAALLKQYKLELVNMYLHFSAEPEKDYEKAVKFVDFMKRLGGVPYMNLQAPGWRDPPADRPPDPDAIKSLADISNRVGKLCKENGITACFHPHYGTAIYHEEDIDIYEKLVNHDDVKLCIDTAHTALAGMDPVKCFEKYGSRIAYVHLKDVDPVITESPDRPLSRFRPLGYGTVDFKGVLKVLRSFNYDDVLCVELDRNPVCNYRSAQISREYIHNVLGL
ncbi:myo-inosose-2 dehydratase [Spirochaetia bacterium]|nr:myo-inosose-2 dehydratase [Spirochaetia bacterium]